MINFDSLKVVLTVPNLIAGVIGLWCIAIFLVVRVLLERRRKKNVPALQTESKETPRVENKYRAIIMKASGEWDAKGRIPQPIGHVWVCDTTMPEPGEHYWVKEVVKDGMTSYEAFDPRTAPIASTTTPEGAYSKTQDWEADIPYIDDTGFMEKLPAIMAYCLMGLTVLAVLIKIGK